MSPGRYITYLIIGIVIVFFSCLNTSAQTVLYVTPTGTGDGSLSNPTDLQSALFEG
jgi:hypothetical protein